MLAPPQDAAGAEPIRMLAVSATETRHKTDPLHWLLLTTEGLAEGESAAGGIAADRDGAAKAVIGWYVRRWTIGLFFKTMKSGTRIKDRRLDHADDLRKYLVFDAVTACHVFDLERLAREVPGTSAKNVVDPEEIDVLHALPPTQGHPCARGPPVQSPDVCAFVIGLGRLVGFHPRNQPPLPGTKKVWQGYERLKWAFFSVTVVKEANRL